MQLTMKNNHKSHLWWNPVFNKNYSEASPLGVMDELSQEDQDWSADAVQPGSGKGLDTSSKIQCCPSTLAQLVNGYLDLDLCSMAKATRIQTDAFPEAKGFWRQPAKQARLVATPCLSISLTLNCTARHCCETLIISASDSQGTSLQTWHRSSCTELDPAQWNMPRK